MEPGAGEVKLVVTKRLSDGQLYDYGDILKDPPSPSRLELFWDCGRAAFARAEKQISKQAEQPREGPAAGKSEAQPA